MRFVFAVALLACLFLAITPEGQARNRNNVTIVNNNVAPVVAVPSQQIIVRQRSGFFGARSSTTIVNNNAGFGFVPTNNAFLFAPAVGVGCGAPVGVSSFSSSTFFVR